MVFDVFRMYIERTVAQNDLLTHSTPKMPSYRNQSINLQRKSIDWFLYHSNFGVKQINVSKNVMKSFNPLKASAALI